MQPEIKLGHPWSVPVRVEDVPETGLDLQLSADEATREQIARLAGLRTLLSLSAEFRVTRRGRGLHVAGEVLARVGQTCVVSLDPIENDICEAVDLLFEPAEGGLPRGPHGEAETEPPEPLREGRIDLGAVATEFLLLGVNPYPRKPGVEFASPASVAAEDGPFAALAALKTERGKGG